MSSVPIQRKASWETDLSAFLLERENAAFVWGRTDCALFAADAVRAMTGEDLAAAYRGRYSTAAGSARALRRYGAGTLEDTLSALLPDRPIGYARRGDLVMAQGAVGICVGAFGLFLRLPEHGPGLERIARPDWSRAWSVGA
ncbi:MAG: hypothetical protein DI537_34695 [Stutzerimonas stutzeri]|nr:MAG: hypothetical protein DI537_34695 [Stutzerimonas stutzeri]